MPNRQCFDCQVCDGQDAAVSYYVTGETGVGWLVDGVDVTDSVLPLSFEGNNNDDPPMNLRFTTKEGGTKSILVRVKDGPDILCPYCGADPCRALSFVAECTSAYKSFVRTYQVRPNPSRTLAICHEALNSQLAPLPSQSSVIRVPQCLLQELHSLEDGKLVRALMKMEFEGAPAAPRLFGSISSSDGPK
jgi:hypothetical protein